jgi:hypothetical protein
MLFASVVYGMSISSYTHRRCSVDVYQSWFILVAIVVACGIGSGLRSDFNFFMLALVPDILLLGIYMSAFFHFGLRQCGWMAGAHRRKIWNPDEKQGLLP